MGLYLMKIGNVHSILSLGRSFSCHVTSLFLTSPLSKGTANFVMKWKESKREASISITVIKGLVKDITGDDNEKWIPTVAFECRGCEPYAFRPEVGLRVVRERGDVNRTQSDQRSVSVRVGREGSHCNVSHCLINELIT